MAKWTPERTEELRSLVADCAHESCVNGGWDRGRRDLARDIEGPLEDLLDAYEAADRQVAEMQAEFNRQEDARMRKLGRAQTGRPGGRP